MKSKMNFDQNVLNDLLKKKKHLRPQHTYFGSGKPGNLVWSRLGNVDVYIEPFCGSASLLYDRPLSHFRGPSRFEILNDQNSFVVNYHRAVQNDPEQVAKYADNPSSEADLIARYRYLAFHEKQKFIDKIKLDSEFYCPKRAGYFVWGLSLWIGIDAFLRMTGDLWRKFPELINAKGICRRDKIVVKDGKLLTVEAKRKAVQECFETISNRTRYVTTTCGDWKRVIKSDSIYKKGIVGIVFDPPYPEDTYKEKSEGDMYGEMTDTGTKIRNQLLKKAKRLGAMKNVRIAICGYSGDGYEKLVKKYGWTEVPWKTSGGYANLGTTNRDNRFKERIWFSPHCLNPKKGLF